MLVERLLELQRARIHPQHFRGRRQVLVGAAFRGGLPPEHQQVRQWRVVLKRGPKRCLRNRVQHDVPQRSDRADQNGCPRALPHHLPALALEALEGVAACDQQRLEPLVVELAERRHRGDPEGDASKHHRAKPEQPGVQLRVGQDDHEGSDTVHNEANHGFGHLGWQRRAPRLRWVPSAGHYRGKEGRGDAEIDKVLPQVGVAWRVGQRQDDAQLRTQGGGLTSGCLHKLIRQQLREYILGALAEAADRQHGVRQREDDGDQGEAELASSDCTLHEGHRDA
mmetsp:Transcript_29059/g.81629  ORF Transcript_29059/g.81629 Transcript_29059/m.81629 type:complete len:281 (+) Transcript_29059:492-1334(+)